MQKDYNRFGKEAFEFKALLCGMQWQDLSKRQTKENALILKFAQGYNVIDPECQAVIIENVF